ncbi:MAG: restriction endonuclease subunit S [Patescibacteria group bacterium]
MTRQTKKLGEICNVKKGKKPELYRKQSGGMLPYLGARFMRGSKDAEFALIEDRNSIAVSKKDLVIICDGSKSGDMFSGFEGVLSSTMGKMEFDDSVIEPNYLKRFLDLNFDLFNGAKKGAAIPHLDFNMFKNLEIPLPPISEQKEIVKMLDEKMGKIAEAKKLRESALADTQKILSQTLYEIFEDGKNTGWGKKMLENIAPIRRLNNKKLLPYVGMEDIESNSGIFIGSLEPKKVQSNTFFFDGNCVLYGRLRPYLNKVLMPDFEGHCSTEMFPLVPDKNVLMRKYLWYWITQKSFIDQAMKTNKGARMPRANMKEVMKFKILIPDLLEQHSIVKRLDALSAKIREAVELQKSQLEDFKKLEKAYLREAFSGQEC